MEHQVEPLSDHVLAHMRRCPLTTDQAARLLEIDADTSAIGAAAAAAAGGGGGGGGGGSGGSDGGDVAVQLRELRQRALATLEGMTFNEKVWPGLFCAS